MEAKTDRFGNPVDSTVSYARGRILKSSAEESLRLLNGRRLVREKILKGGNDAVFNLMALTRAFPILQEDVERLESQFTYYAHFDREVETEVVRFLGGSPDVHDACVMNRVSSAMLAIMCTLLEPGDTLLSIVPNGRSHPSVERGVEFARGRFVEVIGVAAARDALNVAPRPKLAVITPLTHAKHHMDHADFLTLLDLLSQAGVLIFVDDAHVASRMAVYKEPPSLQSALVDLAILSPDKHMVGPRAGALAGRRDLIRQIQSFSFAYGLDAQSSQAAAVLRAIQNYDPEPVARAAELAQELLSALRERYGRDKVYSAGAGVAMSEETVLELALQRAGGRNGAIVPIEATSVVCMWLLERYGIVTIPTVGMPGSSPAFRLMLYPDGARFGLERLITVLDEAIDSLADVLDNPAVVGELILGPYAAESATV